MQTINFTRKHRNAYDHGMQITMTVLLALATLSGEMRVSGTSRLAAPARITLELLGTPVSVQFTDMDGRFRFENVRPGIYSVRVEYLGRTRLEESVDVASPQSYLFLDVPPESQPRTPSRSTTSIFDYQIPKNAQKEVQRARQAQQKSNCRKAIEHLQRAIALFEPNREAHYELGRCYHTIGESANAEKELRRSVEILPSPEGFLLLARVYFDQNRGHEAMAQLRLLVKESNDSRLRRQVETFLRKYD